MNSNGNIRDFLWMLVTVILTGLFYIGVFG